MRKPLKYALVAVVVFLAGAQFIQPERPDPPTNPADTFEAVAKPSPEVAAVVRRGCYDCHSNGTVWPWYSRVAPVSWLVADDVKEGRAHLNFSEWNLYSPEMAHRKLQAACRLAKKGDMPLGQYRLRHPQARLSEQDINALCSAVDLK
jgi:hypothetical protein